MVRSGEVWLGVMSCDTEWCGMRKFRMVRHSVACTVSCYLRYWTGARVDVWVRVYLTSPCINGTEKDQSTIDTVHTSQSLSR